MNLGFTEMAFLVVLGLLLFGPKKLPEIGRQIGRVLAEFKKASNEFQAQLNEEVRKLEVEAEEAKQTILPPEGTTPRLPFYGLEPNSGEHNGEVPVLEAQDHDAVKPASNSAIPEHLAKEPNA
jgi:sec-independent protein translocase protein TatB